jgi:hypothetical protein
MDARIASKFVTTEGDDLIEVDTRTALASIVRAAMGWPRYGPCGRDHNHSQDYD